jgi:hypothetical protein
VILDRNSKIAARSMSKTTRYHEQLPQDLSSIGYPGRKILPAPWLRFARHRRAALKFTAVRARCKHITQQLARNSFSLKKKHRPAHGDFLAQRIEDQFGKQKSWS